MWVTSYELVRQDIKAYAKLHFYCCVLDEAQHIKNASTLASKAVKRLSCRQRFVLTGTPIENRLSELWNLFDFLMPGYLYTNHAFREKLEKPILKSKNPDAVSQLRRLVQPFLLRRLKKDVLKELPPKEEYVRKISLSEDEQKLYYACVQAAVANLGDEQGKLQILAALTRLRQVCCDAGLCFENYEGPTSKLDACVELCEAMAENGHQILLFSQFTSMLDRLRERLDALHISSFTLQGSTPKEKRAAMVKAFNAGSASVFLISLKAGETGLNLTADICRTRPAVHIRKNAAKMLTNAEFLGTLSSKLCDDKDKYGLFPCAESRRVVKGGRGGIGISPWSSALNGLLLGATGLSRYRRVERPPCGGNSGGTTASAALSEGLGRFFAAPDKAFPLRGRWLAQRDG